MRTILILMVIELDCIMATRDSVIKDFEFVDGERTFYCTVEVPGQTGMPPWWWFRLDNGVGTRYAPFEASATDTKKSVQARILAYHAELLAIAARPAYQRPVWRKPEPVVSQGEIAPATAAPATTPS
jgi:hypothetical protein